MSRHIAQREYKSIQTQSQTLLQQTLKEHKAFHSISNGNLNAWKLIQTQKTLNIYRERQTLENEPILQIGSGILPGTMNELLRGIYAETNEEVQMTMSTLLGRQYLSGEVTQVFTNDKKTNIFSSSLKRYLFMPTRCSGASHAPSSMILYEEIGTIQYEKETSPFIYHLLQSTNSPYETTSSPPFQLCFLYQHIQPTWVGCFALSILPRAQPCGELSSMWFFSILHARKCGYAKLFTKRMEASSHWWKSSRSTSGPPSCHVCLQVAYPHSFRMKSLFKRKHRTFRNCAGCGHSMCRSCTLLCPVLDGDRQERSRGKPIANRYFCISCVNAVQEEHTSWSWIRIVSTNVLKYGTTYEWNTSEQNQLASRVDRHLLWRKHMRKLKLVHEQFLIQKELDWHTNPFHQEKPEPKYCGHYERERTRTFSGDMKGLKSYYFDDSFTLPSSQSMHEDQEDFEGWSSRDHRHHSTIDLTSPLEFDMNINENTEKQDNWMYIQAKIWAYSNEEEIIDLTKQVNVYNCIDIDEID